MLSHFKRIMLTGVLSVILAFGGSVGAYATTQSDADKEQQRKALFQIIFSQPDNLEAALEYAALSVALGDLEGAISTLERMLLFAPGLPAIQVELGVLYYKLGNFDTAHGYFKEVLAQKGNIPDELYANVEKYVEAIEKRLKRFRWSAKTFAGIRWQDNVTYGPSTANVMLNGLPIVLPSSSLKKSGASLVTSSRAHFEYDFHTQGDRIELDYVDFGAIQFGRSSFNSQISEINVGPSFNLGRFELHDTYASVYGIANGALLGKAFYFGTLGVGVRLIRQQNTDLSFVLKGEFRNRWYHQNSQRPVAKLRNGKEYRGMGDIRYSFGPNFKVSAGGQVSRKDRRAAHLDYWEFGASLRTDLRFEGFKIHEDLPWRLRTVAGFLDRKFDAPNTVISTTNKRHDKEFWVRGILEVPVTQAWSIIPKVEYRQVNSNYATSDYKAFSATIGVQFSE